MLENSARFALKRAGRGLPAWWYWNHDSADSILMVKWWTCLHNSFITEQFSSYIQRNSTVFGVIMPSPIPFQQRRVLSGDSSKWQTRPRSALSNRWITVLSEPLGNMEPKEASSVMFWGIPACVSSGSDVSWCQSRSSVTSSSCLRKSSLKTLWYVREEVQLGSWGIFLIMHKIWQRFANPLCLLGFLQMGTWLFMAARVVLCWQEAAFRFVSLHFHLWKEKWKKKKMQSQNPVAKIIEGYVSLIH